MATYYIDGTNGNNAWNGEYVTWVSGNDGPWQSIGKANSTLVAGDTVYIRTGTYTETISPTNDGTSGNLITYENYSGESVTVGEGAVQYGIDLQGSAGNEREYIKINQLDHRDGNKRADI